LIHNRKVRLAQRRTDALAEARALLEQVCEGTLDAYEGYRRVYSIYTGTSGALHDLKPLFRIPGIEPDGSLQVNDEFRNTVRSIAAKWLSEHRVGN